MPVIVNGVELSDADMQRELPAHQDDPAALQSAMTSLVLRRLLLDEAQVLDLHDDDEEALIARVLQQQVQAPQASTAECLRHYQAHPQRFTVGELVEASHILFQVTPGVNLDALREFAARQLAELQQSPERFADYAKTHSNCPSGEVGGSLGQIGRGATVPEFESALFGALSNALIPKLVETRFGLHIVYVGRKVAGQLLPFEQVQQKIADAMTQASYQHALRQYLHLLVGRAQISGIDLPGAESPLVQ